MLLKNTLSEIRHKNIARGTTDPEIDSKFGDQVAPFAWFAKFATMLHNLNCHIALECPIGIIS